MPVASAVGVVSYVETIAVKDRKVHELLVGGLRAIESAAGRPRLDGLTADQQLAVLSRIEKTDSPAGFFPLLRDLVYEAYYTHPRVMKLVGYRFRSGRRRTAALEPFDEARLVRVRAMKPLYRDVRP